MTNVIDDLTGILKFDHYYTSYLSTNSETNILLFSASIKKKLVNTNIVDEMMNNRSVT